METVIITGANRGIGLALTRQFLSSGVKVIATCRDPKQATALNNLASLGSLELQQLEITDESSVHRLQSQISGQTIDILINNAGVMGGDRQSLDDMDYAAWADAFATNTMAPFRLITALLDNLKQSNRPRAVTLSSQMGSLNRKSKGSHAYRSSKAAVNKVMQVLSMELEADGIVVCPVHPGWVRTEMGGSQADISVDESAAGLFKLINSLTMEHSGRFWSWEGEEHPW